MADSQTTLVGNLTRDPELKYTPAGRAVCQLGIAVNRRWQNRQTNEWEEQVSFFNITAWAELGENAAESVKKGDRVVVTGRLEQRTYENQDGVKVNVVEIVADEIAPSLRWATAKPVRNDKRQGASQAPHPADTAGDNAFAGVGPDGEPF